MSEAAAPVQTRKRYGVLALVFFSVVINYLDRTNLSVAAPGIIEDLKFSPEQMGLIFSAFGWTYAALQIPGGIVVDRIAPRFLYSFILFFWSFATLLQGFISSFIALFGMRASIGVFEAPAYPMNNKIVTQWFPEHERASAIAIYTSGQFMGMAFLLPVLTTIQFHAGWRGLFIASGLAGIIFAAIWYAFYRDPKDHKTVSQEELDYIEKGGGVHQKKDAAAEKKKFKWSEVGEAFKHRKLWGVYIGQFCLGSVTIFFLTWFPTYLVTYRGIDFLKSGYLAAIPYLAAFCGILLSGFTSDFLVKKGYSAAISRKAPVLCGMLLSVAMIGANFTDSTFWIIFCLALAFFGNGLASITWVFVSLMAPKHLIGSVGGVFNFIGGLSAIVAPTVIGFLVKGDDFSPALYYIAATTVVGFLSFLLVVGKVERIELKDTPVES